MDNEKQVRRAPFRQTTRCCIESEGSIRNHDRKGYDNENFEWGKAAHGIKDCRAKGGHDFQKVEENFSILLSVNQ